MNSAEYSQPGSAESNAKFGQDWLTPGRFALSLSLALGTFFYKVLFGLETFVYRDFGVLAYPTIYYSHERFWHGGLPLWNPLSNCGVPFLAQWGTMALYPFSLIYLLLPLPWSANLFCLLHLFWAGLGVYCLAQKWSKSSFAASAAGLAFVFNGVTFSSLLWPNYTVALGWMPWVVFCVERAWQHSSRRPAVIAALAASMQLLSGVPEIVLLTWLFLAVTTLASLRDLATARTVMLRTLGIILLVTGLTAAQLLPFFDLLEHSQRSGGFETSKWALPLSAWANFFVPLFHSFLTAQGVFFQYGQEFLSSTYLGIGVIVLGLAAVWWDRTSKVWAMIGLCFFGLIMAFGDHTPFYPLARKFIPLVGLARYPVKYLFLVAFVAPLLMAFAIDAVARPGHGKLRSPRPLLRTLWIVALVIVAGILVRARFHPMPLDQWPATWHGGVLRVLFLGGLLGLLAARQEGSLRFKRELQLSFLALMILDAVTHTPSQNPTLPSSVLASGLWQQQNPGHSPEPGNARVLISAHAEQVLLTSRVTNFYNDFLGKRLALWSNLNLLDNVPKVNGSATLQLKNQARLQNLIYADDSTDRSRLLDFLAVSKTTAPGEVVEWTNRPTAMPMVTLGQRPIFADDETTLAAMTNRDFNPSAVVYLPPEAKGSVTASESNAERGKLKLRSYSPEKIEVETEAITPQLLVISQSFYHPWRAYIEGQPTPLWRADYAFQSCEVPAGRHTVTVIYEDRRLHAGNGISMASIAICVLLWFRDRSTEVTTGGAISKPACS